jgi:hypothetical protein
MKRLAILMRSSPWSTTRWKWMVAASVLAKMFILNENGDYFLAASGTAAGPATEADAARD